MGKEKNEPVHPSTAPRPFVFVVMPFLKAFTDTYCLGIKPACEDAGAYCERLDEQIFTEGMLDRIFNQIAKADLIVADMTGKNPNVFYEVGYAHALGKKVVLLTRDADDIPFDLRHRSHIVYDSIVGAKSELSRRVAYLLNEKEPERRLADPISIYIGNDRVKDGSILAMQARIQNQMLGIRLKIFADSNLMFERQELKVALVVPEELQVIWAKDLKDTSLESCRLPSGGKMFYLDKGASLDPGDVLEYPIWIYPKGSMESGVECTLRLIRRGSCRQIRFSFR